MEIDKLAFLLFRGRLGIIPDTCYDKYKANGFQKAWDETSDNVKGYYRAIALQYMSEYDGASYQEPLLDAWK